MKILKNIFLGIILLNINGCGQAGWIGYYSMIKPDGSGNKIAENTDNGTVLTIKKQEIWLEMPRDCSSFKVMGIITPLTPPIPIGWPRSLAWGSEDDCNYFTISTRPETKTQLKFNDKIYESIGVPSSYGYTKYKFPIRSKNIDSGILVIEKDEEKIEVPFEYKYFKFWY